MAITQIDLFVESYFEQRDVSLRILNYSTMRSAKERMGQLLFLPGWASTNNTWRFVIPELSGQFDLQYFETREKLHTQANAPINYSLDSMIGDINNYIQSEISMPFVVVAASVGASLFLLGWPHLTIHPSALVLISPNLNIKFPQLFSILKHLPIWLWQLLRPCILCVLQNTSYAADKSRIAGTLDAIQNADLHRIRESAKALEKLRVDIPICKAVDVPTLVIGATNDTLHNLEHAYSIIEAIPGAELTTLRTFAETHSSRCGAIIRAWLSSKLI